jgi:hypothetical protein
VLAFSNVLTDRSSVFRGSLLLRQNVLPVVDPSLLLLRAGVQLEVLDLRGFNNCNGDDRTLQYMKDRARESFCVFIFDYTDTTDRSRTGLQIYRERVTNKTDAADLLFVLNKCLDRDRADEDKPLQSVLQEKRHLIQSELNLANEPAVVAVEARLWHNAQSAWGATPLTSEQEKHLGQRQPYIDEINAHYSGKIRVWVKDQQQSDLELYEWWKENRDLENLSSSDLRFFIRLPVAVAAIRQGVERPISARAVLASLNRISIPGQATAELPNEAPVIGFLPLIALCALSRVASSAGASATVLAAVPPCEEGGEQAWQVLGTVAYSMAGTIA